MNAPFKLPAFLDGRILVAADCELICHTDGASKKELEYILASINAAQSDLEELRRAICGIAVVSVIDGHDVIRRESVLDLIDRRLVNGDPT